MIVHIYFLLINILLLKENTFKMEFIRYKIKFTSFGIGKLDE